MFKIALAVFLAVSSCNIRTDIACCVGTDTVITTDGNEWGIDDDSLINNRNYRVYFDTLGTDAVEDDVIIAYTELH